MTRMLLLVALLCPAVLAIGEDITVATTRIFDKFKGGKMGDIIAMATDDFYGWFDPSLPVIGGEFKGAAGMAWHLENLGHSLDISKFEYDIQSADEFRRTTHTTWHMEGTVKHTGKSFTITGTGDFTWSRETPTAHLERLYIFPNDAKSLKLAMKAKAEEVFDVIEKAFIEGDVNAFKSQFSAGAKFECHGDYPGCVDQATVDGFLAFISTFDYDVLRSDIIVGTDKQVVVSFSHNHLRSKASGKSVYMNDDDTVIFVFTLGNDGKIAHYEMTFTTDPSPWVFHVPPPPPAGKSPKGDL